MYIRNIQLHSIVLIFAIGFLAQCQTSIDVKQKINGLSFVASRDKIKQKHIEPVLNTYANWVSIMPFGFMESLDSSRLYYNHPKQWYGERTEGVRQSIDMMHKNGIKVMLKPQIWIGNGDFTGHIMLNSEEDWQSFEEDYKAMILHFAEVAEDTKTEMLCIGTELNTFVNQRPKFWENLIISIREVYSGPITYAENWDKINNLPFWSSLDYIGVDAYFPISEQKTPHAEEAKKRWAIINKDLKTLSESYKTPILFTEFGYRSIDYAGKEPWTTQRIEGNVNQEAQTILLQVMMESVWHKDWFAGGFLWKWFHEPKNYEKWQKNRFSVHGKTAENILKSFYKKHK